jgi:spore coat polysaccharide biosynthesis protein SpsF (cytidylyltransferase family)
VRKALRRVTLHKYPAIHRSDEDIVVRIKADAPVLLPDEPIRPTQFG